MMREAEKGYEALKDEFREAMFGILSAYQRGEITDEVLEQMWRAEIKDAWEKAYRFGVRSVGNPFGVWEEDESWLKGAEREEFGYLGKFVEDIKKNELVMSLEDRLDMYIETLDGVYFHGKVDGSPEFVKIHWILREAKHCNTCLRFAAGSPYTKKSLPAVPRDGTSECLSFCKCELRFEYAEQKPEPEAFVIKGPKPVIPPEGYRLPTRKEADKLAAMDAEIDRLRELIKVTTGDVKKELIRQRRDLNNKAIEFMEKHRIYWVPGMQTQKIKFVESIIDDVKKELLIEGGPGSGHWGHKGRPGMRGGSISKGETGNISVSNSFQEIDYREFFTWEGSRQPYAMAAYERVNGDPEFYIGILMKDGDEVVGIASLKPRDGKKVIEVDRLATKRKGYGVKMMREICKIASDKGYGVILGADENAIGFYEKIGMKREGHALFKFSKEEAEDFGKRGIEK
ncbi:MAG: GNAT family N-acetyltransferase [Candidatus Anstonellales archaeon]